MTIPRLLYIFGAGILAAVAGYAGYWFWGADRMDATVDAWIASWRVSGYDISYEEKRIGGFPGAVRLILENPRVRDPAGAWSWSADSLDLRAAPWKPTEYKLLADGNHRAALPVAGRKVDMIAQAAKAEGIANFDLDGRLRSAEIVLEGIAGEAQDLNAKVTAGRVALVITQAGGVVQSYDAQQATLDVLFQDLELPSAFSGPLGRKVDHLSAKADLLGPLRRTDLRTALAEWRDAGGTLDLPWVQINWGPLQLRGEGTATLDETFRPVAALQTRVAGFSETLDAFAADGFIAQDTARVAGLALQLLARSPANGGRPELTVPISVQEGEFYLGPVRMGAVAPILPPEPPTQTAPPPKPVEAESLDPPRN